MAPQKIPGPTGHSPKHHSINDGTSARTKSYPPGTISGLVSAAQHRIEDAIAWLQWQFAKLIVQELFLHCLRPQTSISEPAWKNAAKQLGVEVELIKAVAGVEAPRGPFDNVGRPTILYERQYFHRLTHGKYDKTHPRISAPTGGGYGKYRAQYAKLQEAYLIDTSAALQSVSWGKFQIMGQNYKQAGFKHVEEMVESMMMSEQNQLDAFVTFVNGDKAMRNALQNKAWAEFARRYNGTDYQKNHYDTKLKAAYEEEKKKSAAMAAAHSAPPH
jgi:N-acetylmuramidase